MNSWKTNTPSKRRDKLSIIAEILEIAKDGTLKTQIMYKANLSFAQLNDYVKFMLKTGLINKFRANGKDVYAATEKGLEFLQRHFELTELLQENENGKNGVKIPPHNLLKKN
jgi:predicted transcriptional regulator